MPEVAPGLLAHRQALVEERDEPTAHQGLHPAGFDAVRRSRLGSQGQSLDSTGGQSDREETHCKNANSRRHILSQRAATRTANMAERGTLDPIGAEFFVSKRNVRR